MEGTEKCVYGKLRVCPGESGGLDKGADRLQCLTKECGESLVISEQGTYMKVNYSLGRSIQINLGYGLE